MTLELTLLEMELLERLLEPLNITPEELLTRIIRETLLQVGDLLDKQQGN